VEQPHRLQPRRMPALDFAQRLLEMPAQRLLPARCQAVSVPG